MVAKARPKRIVYLWGAGATHAEAMFLDIGPVNLLMGDLESVDGLSTRIKKRAAANLKALLETQYPVDIEKFISLLAASGTARHVGFAEKMRTYYFIELCSSLASAKVLDKPQLAVSLFEMHRSPYFQKVERLSGVITTNHDGLLQVASELVYGSVNTGFAFKSKSLTYKASGSASAPIILQLHGSFTWRFGLPIQIEGLAPDTAYRADTVWIPPTVLKEGRNYPFNKLFALAYELLARECDVLRVVGCSLTQNDWNILSLLFNAQRHSEAKYGSPFRIELIMPQKAGERIQSDCSYLRNIAPIGFLTEGDFAAYKDQSNLPAAMMNPFNYWLRQKHAYHRIQDRLESGPVS